MTQKTSFLRKVLYIALMAVLLIPLSIISQPAIINPKDPTRNHPGGVLAQQRTEHHLAESELGEIDPTSETMKLATLGMRGVACTVLWQQANEAQKKQNFDALAAVLTQISRLQPHFINVWLYQSWNQSYNVSVEFDDFRYRYLWVKKGIDYLIQGTRYNQRDARLLWHLGWVFGHKFGRSDETKQFRELFHKDDAFHKLIPIDYNSPTVQVRDYEGRIDNWLVSREFFLRGQRLVDTHNIEKMGQSPVIFHSEPAMARMNYAEAIEKDGYFGERASEAWKMAGDEWRTFGNRPISTSDNVYIRLNEQEALKQRADELAAQLDKLTSGLRNDLLAQKRASLTDEQRAALDTPEVDRTIEQRDMVLRTQDQVRVTHADVAAAASDDVREKAERLAAQILDVEHRVRMIDSYRGIVNFLFWRTRAEAEQTQMMVDAHRLVYEAEKAFDEVRLVTTTDPTTGEEQPGAKELYEQAFTNWAWAFEKYPQMLLDNPDTEDLLEHVGNYRNVLDQLDLTLPPDFALYDVIREFDKEGKFTALLPPAGTAPAGPENPPASDDPRAAPPRPPVPVEE